MEGSALQAELVGEEVDEIPRQAEGETADAEWVPEVLAVESRAVLTQSHVAMQM